MTVERLSIYIALSIFGGGLAAAVALNPDLEAGPVRIGTFLAFFVGALLMFRKHIRIVRSNEDDRANLYIVASTYFWLGFMFATVFILYLFIARVWDVLPDVRTPLELRISYFFISGSAVGLVYMAIVFTILPIKTLLGHRVPAWPLTVWKRERRQRQIESREDESEREGKA